MMFEQVPPPSEAPIQPEADSLGLVPGLRVEQDPHGGRCGQCKHWRLPNTLLVWVPDQVFMGDPVETVVEICRRNAYNGNRTGWCLDCALKLSGNKDSEKLSGNNDSDKSRNGTIRSPLGTLFYSIAKFFG